MDWTEDFIARVGFAAKYISSGKPTTRKFDSCFENNDGDVVVVALYRRAEARPKTKLASNLFRYISETSTMVAVHRLVRVKTDDLAAFAFQERARSTRTDENTSSTNAAHILKWHCMLCPSCFCDTHLDVVASMNVRLTEDGSDAGAAANTSHTWTDDSTCLCANCGFRAEVRCFKAWGEEGVSTPITAVEKEGDDPCAFEIMLLGMVQEANGHWVNAEAVGRSPAHFDIELRRVRHGTGDVVTIFELEELTEEEASSYADDFEANYPFATLEQR